MLLRYTLVTDGSSDRTLLPILDWLCRGQFQGAVEGQWFDPRPFTPPHRSLQERVRLSIDLFPCDVLFVHRDAERENPENRYDEIALAIAPLAEIDNQHIPYICVVPVRMT